MTFLSFLAIFFGLQTLTRGQDLDKFVAKHKQAMEAHIMAGYGGGWKECDLLAISPKEKDLQPDTPQFVIDIPSLRAFDIRTSFSKSHCLLITAYVGNPRILAEVIEFGWTAIHHIRLGMALRLGPNLTLDMATNITNLPFSIAAQLEGGEEQFLFPCLGQDMPNLKSSMSHPTYLGKPIRVGLFGIGGVPFIFKGAEGQLDGLSIRLISLLERKMKFKINYITSEGVGIDEVIKNWIKRACRSYCDI